MRTSVFYIANSKVQQLKTGCISSHSEISVNYNVVHTPVSRTMNHNSLTFKDFFSRRRDARAPPESGLLPAPAPSSETELPG